MKVEWNDAKDDDAGTGTTLVAEAPGGWLVTHIREWWDRVGLAGQAYEYRPTRLMTTTYVPDPDAPHVRAKAPR